MGNLFQSDRDLAFWKSINREVYKKFMRKIEIFLYDRNLKDPLYGEALDKSFNAGSSQPSYEIEGYFVELPEWKAKLTKHGLDEARPLKCHFFIDSFQELGVTPPRIGDRLRVEGELYKVMQENPTDYFGNTQKVMTYSVDLQRVRPESIKAKPRVSEAQDMYPESQLKGDFQDAPPVRVVTKEESDT
jgi:hypothetical protein